ncbi:YihY/virulence factor BrkB family protein [Deinococcus radiophilus]|uniref:YihY/virulence factor BrkB family protein n=1 Tax=Deinococcus radiophilus TaxID=32062 RepID=A0A431VQM1_9DEIO|nr:YihY/virulence factor BrkB family protein [Deinococcus radiophilus]RTR25528.1 YihY/virulence factor BrkB family protein [Deinococcus radiophilus]UFA50525.1 YihY/virulence factor BrkB family protein [Deinococcus radiophilus]
MLTVPQVALLIREAVQSFGKDNAPRLAAALTYFTIFALIPLLILAITFMTSLLADPSIQQRIVDFVSNNFGADVGKTLSDLIAERGDEVDLSRGVTTGAIVGLATLAWGATNLFVQLQASLNELWNVPEDATGGFAGQLKTRGKGLLMVLGFGVVMLLFFGLNTYMSAIATQLGEAWGAGAFLARLGTLILGAVLLTGVFAVIYRVLPNVRLRWKDVLVGAAFTAVLFSLLQLVITWYFANFAPGSAFGAYSSIILLLLWIYYNSMALFFGAEMTYAYAKHFGSSEAARSAQVKEEGYLTPREARAIAYAAETGGAMTPQQRQRAWQRTTRMEQPHSMLTMQQSAPKPVLPSIGGALWNALAAVLAVPALLLAKALGLGGTKQVTQKRVTVHTDKDAIYTTPKR